jgi:sulfur-oxidizing protein SoxY
MRHPIAFTALLLATPAHAIAEPRHPIVDPYATGMSNCRQIETLGDPEDIRFDASEIVTTPASAKDSFKVPVVIDAAAIADVDRIVVLVDYGPIPETLPFWPGEAEAKISLRFKINQSTPIRAALRTTSGAWHVGGTKIDAAGGRRTAPAAAYGADDWEQHLGEVRGRIWPETGRVRLIVDHPTDTGLTDRIAVSIIEDLALTAPDGRTRTSNCPSRSPKTLPSPCISPPARWSARRG